MNDFVIREHRGYEKKGVVRPDGSISFDYVSASTYAKPVLNNWFFSRRDQAFAVRGVIEQLTHEGFYRRGWPDRYPATTDPLQYEDELTGEIVTFADQLSEVWEQDLKLADLSDKAARAAGKFGKADLGTILHGWAEKYDLGLPLSQVPEEYRADIEAYAACTAGLIFTHVEQQVVNDDVELIGTADRFGKFRKGISPPVVSWRQHAYSSRCENELYVCDYKTGAGALKGYLSACAQFAGYAHGDVYNGDSTRKPLHTNKSTGFMIWGPAGTGECHLIPLNLHLGWRLIEVALEVRSGWKTRKAEAVGKAMTYSIPTTEWLAMIQEATSREQLVDIFHTASRRGEWNQELTDEAQRVLYLDTP